MFFKMRGIKYCSFLFAFVIFLSFGLVVSALETGFILPTDNGPITSGSLEVKFQSSSESCIDEIGGTASYPGIGLRCELSDMQNYLEYYDQCIGGVCEYNFTGIPEDSICRLEGYEPYFNAEINVCEVNIYSIDFFSSYPVYTDNSVEDNSYVSSGFTVEVSGNEAFLDINRSYLLIDSDITLNLDECTGGNVDEPNYVCKVSNIYLEDGTYSYKVVFFDMDGNSFETSVRTINYDTKSPLIALKGNSSLVLDFGSVYEELGVDVIDNSPYSLNIQGEVNTSQSGNYTLFYNVTDLAGHSSNTISRQVTVLEQVIPVSSGSGGGSGSSSNIQVIVPPAIQFPNITNTPAQELADQGILQEESQNIEETPQTGIARITGAVVGAVGSTTGIAVLVFILALAGAFVGLRVVRSRKLKSKK